MSVTKKIIIAIIAFLNGLWMLWVTFWFLSIPQALPDEYMLVQASSVVKTLIFGLEKKPDSSRFLFINVSKDKALLPLEDPDVPGYILGNEAITDRSKLVKLLQILEKNPNHKFIVFDIDLKGKTEHDSLLTVLINKMPNMSVSYHRDEKDRPDYPEIKIKKKLSLSDIEKVWKQALKFQIFFNDSIKSTPLVIYEAVHKKKFKKAYSSLGIHYIDGHPVLNNFVLDYRIRKMDYGTRYAKLHIGETLAPIEPDTTTGEYSKESAEILLNLTKDRIIFVGDFEDRDIHDTIYGEIPGPIILANAFLALENKDNWVSLPVILLLFSFYFTLTYWMLSSKYSWTHYFRNAKFISKLFSIFSIFGKSRIIVYANQKTKNWQDSSSEISNFGGLGFYILFFASVSILSYFIFGLHTGGLILAFYMFSIDYIKTWINKRIEKKLVKDLPKEYTENFIIEKK
jgi:hypothetical protein